MQYTTIFHSCKNVNFQMKFFNIFLIFAQNIDCRYTLGGSNEYPQSMFWSKNKKQMYTPVHPSFTINKWDVRGYTLHGHVIIMAYQPFSNMMGIHVVYVDALCSNSHGSSGMSALIVKRCDKLNKKTQVGFKTVTLPSKRSLETLITMRTNVL